MFLSQVDLEASNSSLCRMLICMTSGQSHFWIHFCSGRWKHHGGRVCDKLNHNVRFVSQHHFHSFPARPPIRWTMCCQTCILVFHSVFLRSFLTLFSITSLEVPRKFYLRVAVAGLKWWHVDSAIHRMQSKTNRGNKRGWTRQVLRLYSTFGTRASWRKLWHVEHLSPKMIHVDHVALFIVCWDSIDLQRQMTEPIERMSSNLLWTAQLHKLLFLIIFWFTCSPSSLLLRVVATIPRVPSVTRELQGEPHSNLVGAWYLAKVSFNLPRPQHATGNASRLTMISGCCPEMAKALGGWRLYDFQAGHAVAMHELIWRSRF